jgi:hypothetical protein
MQLRKMRGRRRGGIDILMNSGDFLFLSFSNATREDENKQLVYRVFVFLLELS